ncbi:MAG: hypothetical protein ABJF23_17850 [Bryobacteraceae bacterium]
MRLLIGTISFFLCAMSALAQEPARENQRDLQNTTYKVFWMNVGMPMVVVTAAGVLVATYGLKGDDVL